MRAVKAMIKAGLAILFLAAASMMLYGQGMTPLPNDWEGDEPKFEVKVLMNRTIDGDFLLIAINPNTDDLGYFYKKYFKVEWLNMKGRTVGNGVIMKTTCGKEGWAMVTDLRPMARVEAKFKTPKCKLIFEEAPHIELPGNKPYTH